MNCCDVCCLWMSDRVKMRRSHYCELFSADAHHLIPGAMPATLQHVVSASLGRSKRNVLRIPASLNFEL